MANQNEIQNSSKAPEPVGLYPHARKVGNLLFLSGVGPRERGSKQIPGVELDELSRGAALSYPAIFASESAILDSGPWKSGMGTSARINAATQNT